MATYYRKRVTIYGSLGVTTDYQVPLLIGESAGGQFNLEGNSFRFPTGKGDGGDLRFTLSDGVTEIPFWVESVDSGVAKVWLKVLDNLEVNKDIYVYYGKDLPSASDGEATFEFFDDFDSELIDTTKWTKEAENGSITQTSGYLRVGGGVATGPNYGWSSLGSSPGYTGFLNNSIIYRARNSTSSIGELAIRGNFASNSGYKARFDSRSGQGNSILKPPYVVGGWTFISGASSDSDTPAPDTWYTYDFRMTNSSMTPAGSNLAFYRDGVLKRSVTDSDYMTAGQISLQNHFGSYTDYDFVAVRKCVDQDFGPAFLTSFTQETIITPEPSAGPAIFF